MDQIFITGLRLSAIIGCLPAEQDKEQPIIIDVIMNADCHPAAQTDDIAQAISYAAVAECIAHYINNHHHKLVESLAEKLAELLLQQFAITQVTLKIGKPDALSYADNAGVQIVRKK
jgi:dihydroneopterin aldolase